jgi:hypothetical protein
MSWLAPLGMDPDPGVGVYMELLELMEKLRLLPPVFWIVNDSVAVNPATTVPYDRFDVLTVIDGCAATTYPDRETF